MMGHAMEPMALPPGSPEALSSLVMELRRENMRLQHMVSELLVRNQQLRAQQNTR